MYTWLGRAGTKTPYRERQDALRQLLQGAAQQLHAVEWRDAMQS